MDQMLDIHGDEIKLDIDGNQIIYPVVVKVDVEPLSTNTETPVVSTTETPKLDGKQRRSKQKVTLEFITNILTDKYHNSMTVSEIKSKYGIGHDVYKFVNSHADIFIAEFGKKKKVITTDELQEYWKNLKI
jgi:hypothetical protein